MLSVTYKPLMLSVEAPKILPRDKHPSLFPAARSMGKSFITLIPGRLWLSAPLNWSSAGSR